MNLLNMVSLKIHNNVISINRRCNWDNELMAIEMIFRDFQSIELTVFNSVMKTKKMMMMKKKKKKKLKLKKNNRKI